MFLIEKGSELTPLMMGKIIDEFQTKELVKLQNYWNYFKGNQKIMRK